VELPNKRATEQAAELSGLTLSNHVGHDTLTQVAEIAARDTVIFDAA